MQQVSAGVTKSRVYLTGFMGAGKTTVGAILAAQLGWRFFDVDGFIQEREKRSVSAIFADHGETHFRELEAEALRNLQNEQDVVISLGGGAIETEAVRSLLAEDAAGALIFLEAPLDRLIARCEEQDGGMSRPLLRDVLLLQDRYEKRLVHYRMAHLTVATQDLTPEEVAASILIYMAAFTK